MSRSKQTENDPGASSSGGNAYENLHSGTQKGPPEDPHSPPQDDETEGEAKLSLVHSVEQSGMTEIVKDLLEHKPEAPPANPGLTTQRYVVDQGANIKGLLLNKKAE